VLEFFAVAVLLLLTVILSARWILGIKVENALAAQISGHIHDGAKAFLSSEYKVMFPWIAVLFIVLALLTGISQPLPSWQGSILHCGGLHWHADRYIGKCTHHKKLLGEAVEMRFLWLFQLDQSWA